MARSVAWSWPPRTPRASWPCCSARAMAGVMRMKIPTTMPIVTAVVSTRMGSRTAMSMRLPMSMMVPSISSTREADDASLRRTESLVTRVVSSPAGRLVSGSTLPVRERWIMELRASYTMVSARLPRVMACHQCRKAPRIMRLVNAASGGTRLSSAALRESSTHRVASGFARLTAEAPRPRTRAKARVFRCGRTYDQRMALRDRCEWVVLSVTCLRLYGRVLGVVAGLFVGVLVVGGAF